MEEIDRQHMIDIAIQKIEAEWIEYSNSSKSQEDAQEMQRFIVNELIEDLARLVSK